MSSSGFSSARCATRKPRDSRYADAAATYGGVPRFLASSRGKRKPRRVTRVAGRVGDVARVGGALARLVAEGVDERDVADVRRERVDDGRKVAPLENVFRVPSAGSLERVRAVDGVAEAQVPHDGVGRGQRRVRAGAARAPDGREELGRVREALAPPRVVARDRRRPEARVVRRERVREHVRQPVQRPRRRVIQPRVRAVLAGAAPRRRRRAALHQMQRSGDDDRDDDRGARHVMLADLLQTLPGKGAARRTPARGAHTMMKHARAELELQQ